jgi:hypothetical protein
MMFNQSKIKWLLLAIALISIAGVLPLLVSGQSQYPGEAPPSGYNVACEAEPFLYTAFGPFCLHPVYWDIPNYVPRGEAIGFYNTVLQANDIGRVTSYYWQNGEYVYQVLYMPSSNPLELKYTLVKPSELIALPQLP